MAVRDAPTEHLRTLDTTCPTCGAPAERGQLVCLECGSRIALSYRRPPSWKLPVAIAAVVAALAVAGAVLAYEAIDDEAKEEVAATPLKPKQARETSNPKASAKPKAGANPEPKPAAATAGGLVPKGKLYTWPKSLRGFTVVVLSAEDRKTATVFANSVADANTARAGVIGSNDFESLPKGFFVVFAGSYPSRARADKAAARLGRRYQGAFPQLVRR